MSLNNLKAKAKKAGHDHRDVEVKCPDGTIDVMRFREAGPPDYYPSPKRVKKLMIKFPLLQDVLLLQVLVLGTCYLQPEEERGQVPDMGFAEIALNDLELWQAIIAAHKETFPDCFLYTIGAGEEDDDESPDPFGLSAGSLPSGASTSSTDTPGTATD